MKNLFLVLWLIFLTVLVCFGFETVLWRLIAPITVSVSRFQHIKSIVRLIAVLCGFLYLALLVFIGDKRK